MADLIAIGYPVVEKVTPDKAVEGLRQYGGTVLKSSLSKEAEAELQDALAGRWTPPTSPAWPRPGCATTAST
jgi:uncharacterized membrane protein